MAKNWDEVLFPPLEQTIRGTYYGVITQDFFDEECFNLALRAIATFKFPRISTDYTTYYAYHDEQGKLQPIEEWQLINHPEAVLHGTFNEELTFAEVNVLLAWMKYYWAEKQISNADFFDEMYTDSNIKTFSRANLVEKNMKLMEQYREDARKIENLYYRTSSTQKSTMGVINDEEGSSNE